jgi:phosphoglycolate phosphatase-like HAD superfamily hydrolase
MVIISDFDGVLCDQREFDYQSFCAVPHEMNNDTIHKDYLLSLRRKGYTSDKIFKFGFKYSGAALLKAHSIRKKWLRENINNFVPNPINGTTDALKKLGSGIKIIIATKRMKSNIPSIFVKNNHLPISEDDIYCVERINSLIPKLNFNEDDTVINIKKIMLQFIIDKLKDFSSQFYYIGDTLDDYLVAKSIGIKFFGVTTGYVTIKQFSLHNIEAYENIAHVLSKIDIHT